MRVVDESGEVWFCKVYTKKFKWIREGQTVKIRGASVYDQVAGSRQFSLKFASNILTLPTGSKLEINVDIRQAMIDSDREILSSAKGTQLSHPVIASHTSESLPLSRLETALKDDLCKVRFHITSYDQLSLDDPL